eukprot:scaffold25704_cov31-Tisochrysis_lutea.AAC.2
MDDEVTQHKFTLVLGSKWRATNASTTNRTYTREQKHPSPPQSSPAGEDSGRLHTINPTMSIQPHVPIPGMIISNARSALRL